MCVSSMIGDHYRDKFTAPEYPIKFWPLSPNPAEISRAEFDHLKRDVEEMKALLIRAKEYDEANGEPDCEMDEKVALIKKIAKLVGVNLDGII